MLDKQTGLIWARCFLGMNWNGSTCMGTATAYTTWQQAPTTADTSNLAGYTDWRLPNIRELASLVETGSAEPAINSRVFPNTNDQYIINGGVWSSSPYVGSTGYAWFVFFSYGHVDYDGRDGASAVRLVRGG